MRRWRNRRRRIREALRHWRWRHPWFPSRGSMTFTFTAGHVDWWFDCFEDARTLCLRVGTHTFRFWEVAE